MPVVPPLTKIPEVTRTLPAPVVVALIAVVAVSVTGPSAATMTLPPTLDATMPGPPATPPVPTLTPTAPLPAVVAMMPVPAGALIKLPPVVTLTVPVLAALARHPQDHDRGARPQAVDRAVALCDDRRTAGRPRAARRLSRHRRAGDLVPLSRSKGPTEFGDHPAVPG
jgi:hypothetical protein